MRSILVVTTPATDLTMLTLDEMRAAAGRTAADGSQDALLETMGASIASDIMAECNIAAGLGAEPTLYKETLTQTFYDWPHRRDLVLARRHNVVVSSLTIDDSAVDSSQYVVDAESGMLSRLNDYYWTSRCHHFHSRKIEVVYTAGFDALPSGLKQFALDLFATRWAEAGRDDFIKSERIEIPGVELKQRDYWVGSIPGHTVSEGPIPSVMAGRLKRFRNLEMSIG